MTLWIVLIGMTLVAGLIVALPILRARADLGGSDRDIIVYADQLSEIERDRERGLIAEAEAAAARIEIGRRILRADQNAGLVEASARGRAYGFALLAAAFVALSSLSLYFRLGSPNLPDLPLAERKTQSPDRMSADELIARLDDALAKHPDDLKGWDVAGPVYMRVGRTQDAVAAFRRAISLGGDDARRDAGLGEALTASADGVVTAEARSLFEAAAKLDPAMPTPKMYLALALSQDGKLDEAASAWRKIVEGGRGYEPWVKVAKRELAAIEEKRGTATAAARETPKGSFLAPRNAGPPSLPADDPNRPMIETMVAGLSARLEKDGGTAEEWTRLIKSYRVLGRDEDAKSAYEKARINLAGKPDDLSALADSAAGLGVVGKP